MKSLSEFKLYFKSELTQSLIRSGAHELKQICESNLCKKRQSLSLKCRSGAAKVIECHMHI
ncbi:unnamed protein product [Ceratitis capitata]|uniref:(Mediterranean fruit fly) hypothetical protein n=1 Tax=Ceratitis capitata TaxID=7213 RepID=A0A811UWL9_CERCA|nr:unnamed protein product [Ceratitis capitata]